MTFTARELNLLSNTDVLGYIRQQNAERDAQAKAEGWDFWTLMSEDLADEYANVYEMELMFAQAAYSDIHKSWAGFRSSVSPDLTLEEVEAAVADLHTMAEASWQAEQEAANQYAEDIREEYWMDCEAREEEMRMLQLQRDAEEAEDILWDIQDQMSGV